MKATIKNPQENGRNHGHNKETVSEKNVVALYKGELFNPITVRWYMGRSNSASVVFCSIWCHSRHKGLHCAGNGSAGGYGYHKESAALGDALRSAGIELDRSISGAGDTAISGALEAITKALGYTGKILII